ncbi:MAG: glycosyltransferase family 39 protein [Verrucomicrobiota bacterium]|nr:glycosyltransferase family 39 protein [Verrucomicrobiota bacterium]
MTDGDIQRLEQTRYRRLFWLLAVGVTLFRLAAIGMVGLSTDESHYALYARHPAWGYFDHPPMVGLLAALMTLAGGHVFFFRLGPVLCALLSIIVLRTLALELLGSEKRAFWSVAWLTVIPVQHLLAIALLPDATLNVFWCAALLAAWRAFRDGKWSLWIMTGLFFGGALLSKYHGALLPLCLFGYAATSRQTRHWLWSPKPYAAGLAGFLVFLPNVVWNYRRDWISYAYQLHHGGGSGRFTVGKLLETAGGQLVAASPVILALFAIVCAVAVAQRPAAPALRFALWASVPVFVFFCAMGLFGKILPHWTAVGWWGGVIVMADVLARRLAAQGRAAVCWRRWALASGAVGVGMILLVQAAMAWPIVEPCYRVARAATFRLNARFQSVPTMPTFKSKFDLTNDMYGWDQAAHWVEGIRGAMPDPARTFVFAHRFYTTSQLGVHMERRTHLASLHRKPGQYRLWFDAPAHEGWDALFVDDDRWRQGPDRYRPLFMNINRKPMRLTVWRKGAVARVFDVYRCYGYRGKLEDAE